MRWLQVVAIGIALGLSLLTAGKNAAQEPAPPAEGKTPPLPVIADEPLTVDPAEFMPPALAAPATIEFKDTSLRDVAAWLSEEKGVVTLIDSAALGKIGVLPSDPLNDRLDDAPIYLLLDRLRMLGMNWYYEDEVLYITSKEHAESHLSTLTHGVGDLIDAGFKADDLIETVTTTVAPETWEDAGGPGTISVLGDVLFVRQTDESHRAVRGLLSALRKHGRRTFVFDPPQHETIRGKLQANVSVDFRDVPLDAAVRELARITQLDIRLDQAALREAGVRDRQPATLTIADRRLETVLQALLKGLELAWVIRDGVLWVTTEERTEENPKTAIFDVRDLCRDRAESDALGAAIVSQTGAEHWEETGGSSAFAFARPGTLMVSTTEVMQNKVLQLLETYRRALRESKPRTNPEDEAKKVVTVYYRMHAGMADSLADLLPKLVRPDSWKDAAHPDKPGEVIRVASRPEIDAASQAKGAPVVESTMARAVLIVHQTQAAQDEIQEVIRRVESGDALGGMGGGFGGGGGGFGGGFFDVPSRPPKSDAK